MHLKGFYKYKYTIVVLTAGKLSEDYCQVEVDTIKRQGFVSDSDVLSTFSFSPEKYVECVWILHAPVGSRVRLHSHVRFGFEITHTHTHTHHLSVSFFGPGNGSPTLPTLFLLLCLFFCVVVIRFSTP